MNSLWIEDNLKLIKEKINLTCQSTGRNPKDVKLLLATKTVPADRIKQALDAGETLIGENKFRKLIKIILGLKWIYCRWVYLVILR